jgi:hypothetical protein
MPWQILGTTRARLASNRIGSYITVKAGTLCRHNGIPSQAARQIPRSFTNKFKVKKHILISDSTLNPMVKTAFKDLNIGLPAELKVMSMKGVPAELGLRFKFAPRHIISWIHLRFLSRHLHPLTGYRLKRYQDKTQSDSLWSYFYASTAEAKVIVQRKAQRLLRVTLRQVLAEHGFDKRGKPFRAGADGQSSQQSPGLQPLYGTVSLTTTDPKKLCQVNKDLLLGVVRRFVSEHVLNSSHHPLGKRTESEAPRVSKVS